MKIFIRVVYAFLIGFGFFVVFAFADAHYRKEAINEIGSAELQNDNIEFFVGSKYYNKTPILFETVTQNFRTFEIYMYEVASYVKKGDTFDARSGISVVIKQTAGDPLYSRMYVKVYASDKVEKAYTLLQMANLPVYNLTNATNNLPVIELRDFEVDEVYQDITKLEISYSNTSAVTLSFEFNVDVNAFNVATELVKYYQENNEFMSESMNGVTVSNVSFNTDNPLVWLWSGLYVVLVTALTIFLVVYGKKKKMGKKELTPGLATDLEKMNKNKGV